MPKFCTLFWTFLIIFLEVSAERFEIFRYLTYPVVHLVLFTAFVIYVIDVS